MPDDRIREQFEDARSDLARLTDALFVGGDAASQATPSIQAIAETLRKMENARPRKGPRPTPIPVSERKRKRRAARDARKLNRG